MKQRILYTGVLALGLMISTAAFADPSKPNVRQLVTQPVLDDIHAWLTNDIVAVSVKAQNDRLSKLTQPEIDAVDKQWVDEREAADKPLIAATLSNPLSVYLNRIQGR